MRRTRTSAKTVLTAFFIVLALATIFPGSFALAQSDSPSANSATGQATNDSLESRVQNLKKEVTKLNRDLFILEEELLFPASTQVVVFVAVNNGNLFQLDSIELKLDDKVIAGHLYTEREFHSLQKGGVQRLYVGNVPAGKHELAAFFTGQGPNKVSYRRGATLKFEKALTTKYIELKIVDNPAKQQPDFLIKEW